LSLILRKLMGAGRPRELKNRAGEVFGRLRLLRFLLCRIDLPPAFVHGMSAALKPLTESGTPSLFRFGVSHRKPRLIQTRLRQLNRAIPVGVACAIVFRTGLFALGKKVNVGIQ